MKDHNREEMTQPLPVKTGKEEIAATRKEEKKQRSSNDIDWDQGWISAKIEGIDGPFFGMILRKRMLNR